MIWILRGVSLPSGNDELKKYCGKHLISLGSSRLVELINGARDHPQEWILQVLLVHADQPLIDKVFDALKPSNDILRRVAESVDLACMPQRFTYLLREN